jgi:4-amino-4-deoxychorismate lyase
MSTDTQWLVNGRKRQVDPSDRGLAYGDGVFETMAAHDGVLRWLEQHLTRLARGCEQLGIPMPDRHALAAEVVAAVPARGSRVVKLMITRGSGARGYRPPEPCVPTRILGIGAWPDYPEANYTHGIRLGLSTIRLADSPLAGLKHLCRLEQVLAQQELAGLGLIEGLLRDARDRVVSGSMSNLFLVRDQRLVTPQLDRCGVRGVMRDIVLAAARDSGLAAEEQPVELADVHAADELFVTNSVLGIWPVREFLDTRVAVGPITQALQRQLGYAHAQ